NDLARSAGADWVGEYSKGSESHADKVNAAIMTATTRGGEINSAVRHQVAVDEAKPIEDRIASAMSGWTMQQNHDAMSRMVKKGDTSSARSQRAPPWFLGPAGQLQALSCPETNIQRSKGRYGGVHRSISGAATVDVTGLKAQYQLAWNWVEESEVRALEAMHDRIVPGPFWLIDPTRRNRLSTHATKLHHLALTYPGVRVSGGGLDYVKEWPTDAGRGTRCLRWTDQPASDHQLVFDYGKWVPVIPGETLTGSVYVKGGGSITVRMAWLDSAGVDLGTDASSSYTATSSWTRYTV